MRILVLSDSHGHIERMSLAAKQEMPDAIIHLGDHIGDARKLYTLFPDVAFYMVKGNCDLNAAGEKELVFMIDNVKIFIAHGHIYNVKASLTSFVYRAREICVDVALYGHTHKAAVDWANGIWFMNPGQMERHDGALPATYGIITIENGKIDVKLKRLEDKPTGAGS